MVRALVADCGRSSARIKVLENPRVSGYHNAVRAIRQSLVDRYSWYDLWLFFPDADLGRAEAMKNLESDLETQSVRLLCCPAVPEVEIYACAAFRDDMNVTWKDARKNPRLKEEIFQPLLDSHGDANRPGGGRDLMIAQSLKNLPLLYQLCPELKSLRDRIVPLLDDR